MNKETNIKEEIGKVEIEEEENKEEVKKLTKYGYVRGKSDAKKKVRRSLE